ncbi:hypothetical protein C4X99_17225 [Leptospira interrogans serovar Geyaweera]|nr:hypothetical protein C5473_05570 [Leptospira interrogans serovar Weerasinghe]KAA1291841.1 hypothetical protein C4X99_17225 [Leptospira interrogans serovar Geyaweera]
MCSLRRTHVRLTLFLHNSMRKRSKRKNSVERTFKLSKMLPKLKSRSPSSTNRSETLSFPGCKISRVLDSRQILLYNKLKLKTIAI